MAYKSKKVNEKEALIKENTALKAELEKYKTAKISKPNGRNWRGFLHWGSIAIAGAIFVVASIVFYIGMTLTNTDRFMNVAEPLIRQPAVQDAVATKTTQALFKQVDVESLANEVLPDKVDFLAPTVATQIESYTNKQAKNIISSNSFQQAWDNAVRNAHEKLIASLKNYEGDGNIDLNDAYLLLSQRLTETKLDFLAGKQLPPKIGSINLINAEWLPTAHNFVSNFNTVRAFTIILFLILLLLSVYLSSNRRKGIIQIGWLIAILSFLLLLTLRVTRSIFLSSVDPVYKTASEEIWSVFTRPFALQLITTLIIGLVLVVIAWIGGQSKSATNIRNKISLLFAGKIHATIFDKENALTLWVGKYEKPLLTLVGALFVISLLFIDLSLATFSSYFLIALIFSLLIVTLSGKKDS